MNITLLNDDPFGNNVRVIDENDNGRVIFSGYLPEHSSVPLNCKENYAGYGNIITYQDSNPGLRRGMLKDGDVVSL